MKKRIWLCLTFVWLCVIFGHSLMPASLSQEESLGVFAWLGKLLPWLTHHLLRKMAHFSAFAILGGLLTGTLLQFQKSPVCAVVLAFFAAFADETIQLFVAGRSGQISDVWIDLAGASFAVVLLWLLRLLKRTCKGSNP